MRFVLRCGAAAVCLAGAAGLSFAPEAVRSLRAAPQAALAVGDLAALEFRNIGPANMSGRFVDLAVVESDTTTFYVASATGGVFKTTDNGITYAPVFDREAVHSVGDIEIFQPNPNIVWVGTGERANRQSSSWGDGVYKSTDAGRTWTNVGLRESHHIGRIVAHPTNPDIVFVAAMGHLWGANPDRGLYRTTDGGRTWTAVLQVNADTGVVDVAMDPSDPNVLYAATYQRRRTAYGFHGGGPGSGLYKSTDGGSTWRTITGSGLPEGDYGRIGIAIYRKDPRIVYVCIEQGNKYNASTAYIERRAGIFRSEDKGATWTFMSDWNPRPMYASQITIDPNDDKRIYMVNSYSFSDDGGKTFQSPGQTLHGDDRLVWVDPKDSRHVIKLDDGSVGISYDRGLKWLYVSSLPVSQFYRVAVDNATPFNVYGGLQDNGCWMGPSASYFSSGILNEDWKRLCGGDGFFTIPDPTDNRIVYAASQFLGLVRNDTRTWESQSIRPGDPKGAIAQRRNFDVWSDGLPEPELANAMHPANWDAPFMISPHDPSTIYAGMKHLFRSRNRGQTWEDLGNLTSGIDRRTLQIMGQEVADFIPSLDDGVPYWPTISALAESPRVRGVIYVGTDDGRMQVSRDDGTTFADVSAKIPGLPARSWIAGIEASRHQDGTVYVTVDNHRSDDFKNYVYKSTDYGQTWTSIAGDLPAGRVARTIREDAKNPNLLYLGTELGLFVSVDGGTRWLSFRQNMPTLAINDLIVHPRDNDLVLGTHGRGVWILDNVAALQELTPEVVASSAYLFTPEPAAQIRYTNLKAHTGDMWFSGANPPQGAIIDYWLASQYADLSITILDAGGREIASIPPRMTRGINRVTWNLRHSDIIATVPGGPPPAGRAGRGGGRGGRGGGNRLVGPLVAPGTYTVRLHAAGRDYIRPIVVSEDPRIDLPAADRRAWTESLLAIGDAFERAVAVAAALQAQPARGTAEDRRIAAALPARLSGLYGSVENYTGRPTTDQQSQLAYYRSVVERLEAIVK
ncbi:MAG TPA: hypothetical protein VFO19_11390 [Vicinamibacterales bacterium]|nr:hypothetical protein [Vicinamibacterales bacterium]